MNTLKVVIGAFVVVIVALVGIFATQKAEAPGGANESVIEQEAQQDTAQNAGSYEVYAPEKIARAEQGKVVLFFRAPWCPTCRALDADIRANLNAIPKNVTILDVDYDSSIALKQQYGVTYQHTLIQVNAQGNQIARWNGTPLLAELLSRI